MEPIEAYIPADVPEELVDDFLQNLMAATSGTGRMNLFACDQKIEHLNDDFYDGGKKIPLTSNDPKHLFEIGSRAHKEGTIGVLAGQYGLISRYAKNYPDIPYLVKMNSKSHLVKTAQREPISLSMCNMDDINNLRLNGVNVVGIGYTIYLGSEHEPEMLTEAAMLISEAHQHGLIAVTWIYPRGSAVPDEFDPQLISGASGLACCIGADFTKVNYPKEPFEGMTIPESLGIAVESAGRTGLICSGGGSLPPEQFLHRLWEQVNISGARGAATGRNIHQKPIEDAVKMCAACHAIICNGATVEEALQIYNS
jgi:DhnA family fructose-bisphosphate aldolase class Ia